MPGVVAQCNNMDKLRRCETHLTEAIELRTVENDGCSGNSNQTWHTHRRMIQAMKTGLQRVKEHINTLASNSAPPPAFDSDAAFPPLG